MNPLEAVAALLMKENGVLDPPDAKRIARAAIRALRDNLGDEEIKAFWAAYMQARADGEPRPTIPAIKAALTKAAEG